MTSNPSTRTFMQLEPIPHPPHQALQITLGKLIFGWKTGGNAGAPSLVEPKEEQSDA